ncbi:hypothetical protein EDB86DRAFT_90189 [Lactarius hatsudake]|nr:hypothetical protein EDB86DRAFT_90189 [Lactarius hatsudake]
MSAFQKVAAALAAPSASHQPWIPLLEGIISRLKQMKGTRFLRSVFKLQAILVWSYLCKNRLFIFCSFNNTSWLLHIVHTNRRMDILSNGDFCSFLFGLLGSMTDFTPRCKFDRALAPQGEITFYNSIACTTSPQIYHGCSHWRLLTLYSNKPAWHLARSLGSGGLGLYFLRLPSLLCRTVVEILNTFIFFVMISYLQILLYLLYFFLGRKDHGKRVI